MYMYVLHNKEAHSALRAIAMLVVVALMFWILGVIPFSQKVDAANVTSFSDTLSDTDVSVAANHTIRFTLPNGAIPGETITINFPIGFSYQNNGQGFDNSDIDLKDDGVDITLATTSAGATWGVSTTSQSITFDVSGSNVASSSEIAVFIGTHASTGITGNTQIVNPTAGQYEITVSGGTIKDSGRTRVMILNNVDVTADVSTSFNFQVSGLATSSPVNGTTTTKTATATAIPFGNLVNGEIDTLAQQLHVTTNAAQGFAVTIYQDSNFLSSTGADIDGFANGTYTNTPTVWTHPTNSVSDERTWGHWGITSMDDYNGDEFAGNEWVSASTTPRTIFTHASSSDGITDDIGSTTIGFQAEITSLQEAGDDYTTTLTYVATPTF